ncbi:phage major capsid protein [Halomonas getboli]|uniref:phage major capsid protein n=1 Tax=Halomonas getboli TaxID=2935862 RepID=UPI001FFF0C4C|nr:phage major capsid protein [Halomonas getboli]MCK2185681.1 phage major capsid protein [Halomonas getboli]
MSKKTTKSETPPDQVVRQIQSEPLQRALTVVEDSIDQDARTVEVAVSSEYPFRRWFGMEILDHSPESVDLTRLQNGAPLLDQHNDWRQIGVVEEAWLDGDRKLRARVRFSRSTDAEAVWQDVVDGIRRHISTRYLIHEMVLESERDGVDTYRVTRWEPFEVSSVSIPVDPTVGVGRSLAEPQHTITVKETRMTTRNKTPGADDNTTPGANPTNGGEQQRGLGGGQGAEPRDNILAQERQRVADITEMGERFGQRSLAQEAIQKGHGVDQVRAMLLERLNPQATPAGGGQQSRELPNFGEQQRAVTSQGLGVSEQEAQRYSLMRALEAAATNDWSKAGFERELSIAVADKLGTEARGFYVPHDMLMRAYAHHPMLQQRGLEVGAAGKGGELVATDLRVDQFIDILRNRTVIARLGARMLSGLEGDVDIPKKVNGANFYWLGENEDVANSDFDLSTLGLTPKTIAGAIPVSRKLRKQSSMSVEAMIIDDLISGIGVATDLAQLNGDGLNNKPLGLLNQTGLGALEFPNGGIDWASIVEMETKVATYNADDGALNYVTGVGQRGAAKKTEAFAGTGERIWTKGNEVNGYGAVATNQMPLDTWLFGDWSQIVIGLWGVLDLKPDPYAQAASDGLVVRVFQDLDTNVRRPEAFCKATRAAAA